MIQERFDLLLHKYQIGLEQSMKSSTFTFDYVPKIHYICSKINLKRGGSYTDSLK